MALWVGAGLEPIKTRQDFGNMKFQQELAGDAGDLFGEAFVLSEQNCNDDGSREIGAGEGQAANAIEHWCHLEDRQRRHDRPAVISSYHAQYGAG